MKREDWLSMIAPTLIVIGTVLLIGVLVATVNGFTECMAQAESEGLGFWASLSDCG